MESSGSFDVRGSEKLNDGALAATAPYITMPPSTTIVWPVM
jgi:hypothetical protein